MTFDKLVEGLEDRLRRPLPGSAAHDQMRAYNPTGPFPNFNHKMPPKPGSVLILLYPGTEDAAMFPLIKRPDYAGAHGGQVSFPGGKAEAGENYVATALREAWEEIGVDVHEPKVIGRLTDFFVVPSNFLIVPVVAYMNRVPTFIPHTREVSRIIQTRLDAILPPESIREKEILAGGQFRLMAPHFEIDGEIVWGATAMILNELRICIKELRA